MIIYMFAHDWSNKSKNVRSMRVLCACVCRCMVKRTNQERIIRYCTNCCTQIQMHFSYASRTTPYTHPQHKFYLHTSTSSSQVAEVQQSVQWEYISLNTYTNATANENRERWPPMLLYIMNSMEMKTHTHKHIKQKLTSMESGDRQDTQQICTSLVTKVQPQNKQKHTKTITLLMCEEDSLINHL